MFTLFIFLLKGWEKVVYLFRFPIKCLLARNHGVYFQTCTFIRFINNLHKISCHLIIIIIIRRWISLALHEYGVWFVQLLPYTMRESCLCLCPVWHSAAQSRNKCWLPKIVIVTPNQAEIMEWFPHIFSELHFHHMQNNLKFSSHRIIIFRR